MSGHTKWRDIRGKRNGELGFDMTPARREAIDRLLKDAEPIYANVDNALPPDDERMGLDEIESLVLHYGDEG